MTTFHADDSRDDAKDGGGTTSGTKEAGGVGNEPPRTTAASDVPVSGVGLPGGGSCGTRVSYTSPGAVAGTAAEGERRLRALVRAVLSPGVWLVIGAQLVLQLALTRGLAGDEPAPAWLLVLTGLLFGFAWLQAGAYRSLAHGHERLSAVDTLRPGLGRFGNFLWLFIKLGLLVALLSNIVVFLFTFGTGLSPLETARLLPGSLGMLAAVIGFTFVYWLPLVFVTDDFRLFATLRRAIATAWRRLPQSGYLALLILLPATLFTLLPADTSSWLLLPLAASASLLGWAAYIYCAEWLRDTVSASLPPVESAA